MNVCSFAEVYKEISCGQNVNITPTSKRIPLQSCNADITAHLKSNHIAPSSVESEYDLIRARSGYFEDKFFGDYIICPNHRFYLGKGLRSSRLCMAKESLQNCGNRPKTSNTTISVIQSRQIWHQCGLFIPVGVGFCRQCRGHLGAALKETDYFPEISTVDNAENMIDDENPSSPEKDCNLSSKSIEKNLNNDYETSPSDEIYIVEAALDCDIPNI